MNLFFDSTLLSALVMGLLGGVHCVGMCGGIVTALTIGTTTERHQHQPLGFLLAYNVGRILSYTVAGGGVALLSHTLTLLGEGMVVRQLFNLLSATVMILLGLYLGGWWPRAILIIERGGGHLWHRIQPLAQRLIPIRTLPQAVISGMVWGWLPCGLVYTALLWATAAATPPQGMLIMAAFGLGTLPTLLGIGLFSEALRRRLQRPWVRSIAGIMVIFLGLYQLVGL